MTGRARGRVFASLIAIAAAFSAWSVSAQAATVTVGSPTLSTYGGGGVQGNNGSMETLANLSLYEPKSHEAEAQALGRRLQKEEVRQEEEAPRGVEAGAE